MENQGWIKLHRKMLDNSFHDKANYGWLWITLLMMANHKETKFIWNGKEEIIKEGQILTGRVALSKQTGISQTTIERILTTLENGHQIKQQKTTKFRLITIEKWEDYQNSDSNLDNKRTTNGHIQECKNEKKDILLAGKPANDIKIPLEEDKKTINLQELYKGFGLPKKVRAVNLWQDEASAAVKYFSDVAGKESSIFKCFKDNQSKARIAFSDCKELGKSSCLYFFKVFNSLKA